MYSKGLWIGFTFAQAVPLACNALTYPACMAFSSRLSQPGLPRFLFCFLSLCYTTEHFVCEYCVPVRFKS